MGANSNTGKPIMLNQYVQTENLEIIIKKYLDFKTVPRALLHLKIKTFDHLVYVNSLNAIFNL